MHTATHLVNESASGLVRGLSNEFISDLVVAGHFLRLDLLAHATTEVPQALVALVDFSLSLLFVRAKVVHGG